MRFFILIVANLAVFIAVRYFSLLSAFLLGMGAYDHYKYESYAYIPGTVIHLAILFIIAFKSRNRGTKVRLQYMIIAAILIFLSVVGFLNIVPYSIIPY